MIRRIGCFSTAAVAVIFTAIPAAAVFVPGLPRPSTPVPTPPTEGPAVEALEVVPVPTPTKSDWEKWRNTFWEKSLAGLKESVNGLALNLDYNYSHQDVSFTVPGVDTFEGESTINTFSARLEYVPFNWLSIYGLGATHEGSTRAAGMKANLNGWGAGGGVSVAFALPVLEPSDEEFDISPFFAQGDFNMTTNEFRDVEDRVNIINVSGRFGILMRFKYWNFGAYAGPAYQSFTEDQVIEGIAVEAKPENAWNGIIGLLVGIREDPNKSRPPVQLIVQGAVGNRTGALASLRYEYDLPGFW